MATPVGHAASGISRYGRNPPVISVGWNGRQGAALEPHIPIHAVRNRHGWKIARLGGPADIDPRFPDFADGPAAHHPVKPIVILPDTLAAAGEDPVYRRSAWSFAGPAPR